MKIKHLVSGTCVALLMACNAQAQLVEKKMLTLAEAKKVLAASAEEARKNNWNVTIVVSDDSGYPIAMERMDKAIKASAEIAEGKAKTAALFKRPSGQLEEAIAKGRTALVSVPGYVFLQGGMPIVVNGEVIGAVGVSGVQSIQDEQIAKAGADSVR